METRSLLALLGLGMLMVLSSCVNRYDTYPEGTVVSSAPVGYETVIIAGITYWYLNDHYYRHWPGSGWVVVRPPYGRPPYQRPPAKPPRPEHPIERPKPQPEQPIQRPVDRPSTQPVQRPVNRPVQRPSTQPVQRPVIRPAPRVPQRRAR